MPAAETTLSPANPARWLQHAADVKAGRLSVVEIAILLRGGPDYPKPAAPAVFEALNLLCDEFRKEMKVYSEFGHWALFWQAASEYLLKTSRDGDVDVQRQAAESIKVCRYCLERVERAAAVVRALLPPDTDDKGNAGQ